MSAYNILHEGVRCSECNKIYGGQIQFKFGDTWLHRYHIGDVIKWGGNDIEASNIPKVKVYGILENDVCPICNSVNKNNEYDIIIENDLIKKINSMVECKDYLNGDGNYKILKVPDKHSRM